MDYGVYLCSVWCRCDMGQGVGEGGVEDGQRSPCIVVPIGGRSET